MKNVHVGTTVVALFAGANLASAQTEVSVSGTVTDPSGAHVAGAVVRAFSTSTGVSTPVTANEAGVYTMPSLPTGNYMLTTEHPGFREFFRMN